jgi:glycosyltransferase involved in cell wall biosynthesis
MKGNGKLPTLSFFTMKTDRVLFICTNLSSFVKGDLSVLEDSYRVKVLRVSVRSKLMQLFSLIYQFCYMTVNIRRFKLVYIWFADYHSFFPVIFARLAARPSLLVVGGYDICRIRKVKYGSFVNPVRGFMARYSMNKCSRCLCVSSHVARVVKAIAPHSKREVVYNGIGYVHTMKGAGVDLKTPSQRRGVLCVAVAKSPKGGYIKGLDRFISASRNIPELSFTLVGSAEVMLKKFYGKLPGNLTVISVLSQDELIEYYINSKVYCQLSRSESFGLALAEAMYYNCIPVYAKTGGMKEIAGKYGYQVSGDDPEEITAAISAAHSLPGAGNSRERIEQFFTLGKRAETIASLLASIKR